MPLASATRERRRETRSDAITVRSNRPTISEGTAYTVCGMFEDPASTSDYQGVGCRVRFPARRLRTTVRMAFVREASIGPSARVGKGSTFL